MANTGPEGFQERDWITRAQRGDSEAFAPLVEHYRRRVFSLVYHLVRRHDEVEDLAQEIFIKAFRAIRSYNFESSFGTWLGRIAVNHCYDYLRRVRSSRVAYHWEMSEEGVRELEARAESPLPGGLTEEERTALKDLVGKLLERAPENDRIILTLKELEDYSIEEISGLLKLT
ncbi:MAG: sigma-70 family RNA polymerase sigma factor, partial [Acidobacteriia bacterium]|nr:sigma-70 family RNA polymerase sigma factor [Terriglobia bacterium]